MAGKSTPLDIPRIIWDFITFKHIQKEEGCPEDHFAEYDDISERIKHTFEKTELPHKYLSGGVLDRNLLYFNSTYHKRRYSNPIMQSKLRENLEALKDLDIDEPLANTTLRKLITYEQMCKIFGHQAPYLESTIDLPLEKGKMVTFEIEEIVFMGGYRAYGLTPKDKSHNAFLFFPGTSSYPAGNGPGITVCADLDPLGPGFTLFQIFKQKVDSWLTAKKEAGYQVDISGHSLGGAIAATAYSYLPEKVDNCWVFGAPNAGVLTYRKFEKLSSEKQKNLIHLNHALDMVAKIGMHPMGTYYELIPEAHDRDLEKGIPSLDQILIPHCYTVLDKRVVVLQEEHHSFRIIQWAREALMTSLLIAPYFLAISCFFVKRILVGSYDNPYICLIGPFTLLAHKISSWCQEQDWDFSQSRNLRYT